MTSRAEAARKKFVGAARAKDASSNSAAAAAAAASPSISSAAAAAKTVPDQSIEDATALVPAVPAQAKRSAASSAAAAARVANQVPDEILNNEQLKKAIEQLPANYNFEIHKTLWQVQKNGSKRVALQFPEGLLMYSLTIADILERFAGVETLVMGDVTYGACCIDDFTAVALGCDFMVHYGHSCLIPVNVTSIKTLYVFVDIGIDVEHFVNTVKRNFESGTPLIMVATIQFISSLQIARRQLETEYPTTIPQARPLSPGEILGCTSPELKSFIESLNTDKPPILMYLGDGRFHLESIMISNPTLRAFRYDPYSKEMTREMYDHEEMRALRSGAINSFNSAKKIGVVMGTLGRQGNPRVVEYLEKELQQKGDGVEVDVVTVLLSEMSPAKMASFGEGVDAWVQTSCPRLSIDWGHHYAKPLLSPYEAAVAIGKAEAEWRNAGKVEEGGATYPMDFYAKSSKGPWTPNYTPSKK
ncbi:Diphthamide biosynthesis protein 1 [Chytridiales sp. JEL 0842]|nr:Diphthamide biosynthesis protein 1 [Chytridiales sp. JEL 0842]